MVSFDASANRTICHLAQIKNGKVVLAQKVIIFFAVNFICNTDITFDRRELSNSSM